MQKRVTEKSSIWHKSKKGILYFKKMVNVFLKSQAGSQKN